MKETISKNTKSYKDDGWDNPLDAGESSLIAAEDVVPYSRSLSRLRSYQAGVEYAAEKSLEKGIEIGTKNGVEMGKEYTARSLIKMKFDDDFIAEITGLSSEKIQEIRNNLK